MHGLRTLLWNDGYGTFRKATDFRGFSPSDALVLVDERDDSIDDGEFATDMGQNQIPNIPAGYHDGLRSSFTDGHCRDPPPVQPRSPAAQQMGAQNKKWVYVGSGAKTGTWPGCWRMATGR